ncbi:Aldehyde/histidinol dehydrogenase [Tribonema minus]|uniref:Aldehyde/histidinol dehydrogenase n=1 Tax=Tribonema minus TaxID=303371 RepID=A0A835YP03_9STRA|nr:Aldehyde/histidinol dehydrogenase [Tribonema minus]
MLLNDPARPGFIQCYDPATLQKLGEVKAMTAEEVNEVVAKAAAAQVEWAKTSFKERKRVLQTMQEYFLAHQDDIVRVACRDSGKSKVDALLGEVLVTCEKFRCTWAHGAAWLAREKRPAGPLLPHKTAYVEYHPLGVLGVIAPWNYPCHNVFNHVASGLFAGNAVVTKVSEYTSWSSRYFGAIAREALRACGHSPDLCAIVTGFGEAGAALVACPQVAQIIFTGSPGVGRKVAAAAAPLLKPVILELGGKDPMVVCDDARVAAVLPFALRGVFQNCGQNCCGVERVYAYAAVYDAFCAAAARAVAALRQGPALGRDDVDCGAMVMPAQLDIVQALVDDAVAKGARLLAGGRRNARFPDGLFYEPTVLADVTHDMRIAREEVFGPVMCILKVPDDSDATAAALVNDCAYGLGASVFSGDAARGARLARALRCGMASVNDFAVFYMAQALPFGGVKDSGYGRFAGPEGLRACCLLKSVVEDTVPFIRTVIPGLLQYPIAPGGLQFARAMVGVTYGAGAWAKARAVAQMVSAMWKK